MLSQDELPAQPLDVDGRVLEVGDLVADADVTGRGMIGRVTRIEADLVTAHTDNVIMIYVTSRSVLWRWIDPDSLKARSFVPSEPMPITFDSVR